MLRPPSFSFAPSEVEAYTIMGIYYIVPEVTRRSVEKTLLLLLLLCSIFVSGYAVFLRLLATRLCRRHEIQRATCPTPQFIDSRSFFGTFVCIALKLF